jgi:hypothetical protein
VARTASYSDGDTANLNFTCICKVCSDEKFALFDATRAYARVLQKAICPDESRESAELEHVFPKTLDQVDERNHAAEMYIKSLEFWGGLFWKRALHR